MAVENASTPDQLDASLPAGTDFKNEGDNHLRLIKSVIKNTLAGITGSASQVQAENIASPVNTRLMTPLRVFQAVTARIATQALAEGGVDNNLLMTSLRTKQYVDNRMATGATATGGTDTAAPMSSLAVKQYVDNRLASESEAVFASDNTKLITPLRAGQTAQIKFDSNFTARTASETEAEAGAVDNKLMTPLKSKIASTARWQARTSSYARTIVQDATSSAWRTRLGLSAAATASISSTVGSTSTTVLANSAAAKTAYDRGTQAINEANVAKSQTQEAFGEHNAYVWAMCLVGVSAGGTVSGSNLRAVSFGITETTDLSGSTYTFEPIYATGGLSGTWRNMGNAITTGGSSYSVISLFIRIS